jgi:cyd operon protein YbgT
MWYFTWILGVSLAVTLAVLNGALYEARITAKDESESSQ